jgi:hypothetical protein
MQEVNAIDKPEAFKWALEQGLISAMEYKEGLTFEDWRALLGLYVEQTGRVWELNR